MGCEQVYIKDRNIHMEALAVGYDGEKVNVVAQLNSEKSGAFGFAIKSGLAVLSSKL